MLYLSSIRKFRNYKCDVYIDITRFRKLVAPDVLYFPELAPSKFLLKFFKSTELSSESLGAYYYNYKREIQNNNEAKKRLKYIEDILKEGKDVCLICFCSDYRYCHRTILGKWFEQRGFKVHYS